MDGEAKKKRLDKTWRRINHPVIDYHRHRNAWHERSRVSSDDSSSSATGRHVRVQCAETLSGAHFRKSFIIKKDSLRTFFGSIV